MVRPDLRPISFARAQSCGYGQTDVGVGLRLRQKRGWHFHRVGLPTRLHEERAIRPRSFVFSSETAGWDVNPGNSCLRRDQSLIPVLDTVERPGGAGSVIADRTAGAIR